MYFAPQNLKPGYGPGSAYIFLRWFKLAHICIQVSTLHDGCKQGIDQKIIGNRFHVNVRILSPENCKQSSRVSSWKAKVTAEKNKQTQDWNEYVITQTKKSERLNKLTDINNTSATKGTWLIKYEKRFLKSYSNWIIIKNTIDL